jgi:nucleoid-associated protein
MFDRQRSGRVYADIERKGNTFAEVLDAYLDGQLAFLDFSRRLAQELTHVMQGATLATGGYMAIADFVGSPRQLLIIMIRQEEGYAVDPDTLELRQSVHLDLSTINVGARLNLDAYSDHSDRPLALVRGLKEVAKYFRTFLGVTDYKSAEDETSEFACVLDVYFHENQAEYPQERIEEVRLGVAHHLREHRAEPISLMAVSGIVNPVNPEHFLDFANSRGVSAEFAGDPAAVKSWFRVRYRDKRLLLDFDKSLLHDSIHWDQNAGELTLDVAEFPSLEEQLKAADQ